MYTRAWIALTGFGDGKYLNANGYARGQDALAKEREHFEIMKDPFE
jgi:hypothetical protein